MVGIVTSSDVLWHFRIIWVEFGSGVAFACIGAMLRREHVTFLELVFRQA